METKTKKKSIFSAIFRLCPVRHILLLAGTVIIALHVALRNDRGFMMRMSDGFIRPVHRALSVFNSHVPFSVAECLIGIAAAATIVYIIHQIIHIITHKNRLRRVYITVITLLTAVALVYAGFCVLWGAYFYADDFMERSGLDDGKVSVEQLERVTKYFAALANEYGGQVQRDENGLYCTGAEDIIAKSPEVFRSTEKRFECLAGPDIAVKPIYFSRVMSYTDFTGFFFPFTAEANVNIDSPTCMLASTVAHELSHQRGVAKEQEANFVAVMACLDYGDADYCYSACLLAYIHLGNALYKADKEAWREAASMLSDEVWADLRYNSAYWEQFETPVQTVSNTVYESFMYSYDQDMGLKSYGACVDLLVNYYDETAKTS